MVSNRTEMMQYRAAAVGLIRRFFTERGFLEVDTPVALPTVAPEPNIDAVPVAFAHAEPPRSRFLQTSPELPMKKLLAGELPRIFQIAAVFRDEPLSPWHRPEFRLLEWYRRDAGWEILWDDCTELLRSCARALNQSTVLQFAGRQIDLAAPFLRWTVDEAFQRFAGFSILDAAHPTALAEHLATARIPTHPSDCWIDLFHRAFLNLVEPALSRAPQPVFLTHFPAPLASLARLSPNDPRVAERFELYVAGVELANGFGELTDAQQQQQRFERDRKDRLAAGKPDYPLDETFLQALKALPPSAGIALGLERLLMLLTDAPDIDEVSFIPWSQP